MVYDVSHNIAKAGPWHLYGFGLLGGVWTGFETSQRRGLGSCVVCCRVVRSRLQLRWCVRILWFDGGVILGFERSKGGLCGTAIAGSAVFTRFLEACLASKPTMFETPSQIQNPKRQVEEHLVNGREAQLLVHRKGSTRAFPPHHPLIPVDYQLTGQPVGFDRTLAGL